MTVKNKHPNGSALAISETIKTFDQLLANAGITTATQAAFNARTANPKSGNPEEIFRLIIEIFEQSKVDKLLNQYDQLLELTADITIQIEENSIFEGTIFPQLPSLVHDNRKNIGEFIRYVSKMRAIIQPQIDREVANNKNNAFMSILEKKRMLVEKGFFYEFTDGDVLRIQELINELRNQISSSSLFEEKHKARLLKRLESLQSELHKKMSDVDKFWGLLGDAGVALGKFGTDAKPIVDRIKELTQIVWRTQSHAEQLPSSCENPLLESIKSDEI